MVDSPKGRRIEWIEGNADDIVSRGREIENLGLQMQTSAGVLRQIADGATGMKGLSVDKIREVTGDVYEQLQLAGERYAPTGDALKDYGTTLSEVQTGLHAIIEACETSWAKYQTKQGDAFDLKFPVGFTPPPATPAEETAAQDKVDEADAAVTSAKETFDDHGDDFDKKYDTWETAFDLAVNRIGNATDGGISDSWKDDMNGMIEIVLSVLSWVGIALAILCIVVGGPIFAALAAIVAIVSLIGTIILFAQGKKSGWDLAWAIVGVIPFGKLTQVLKPGGAVGALKAVVAFDEFAELGGAFKAGWTAGAPSLVAKFGAGGSGLWTKIGSGVTFGTDDMLAPMFGANKMSDLLGSGPHAVGGTESVVAHILDWNMKTVLLPIVGSDGIQSDLTANTPSDNQSDTWSQQLAGSNK
jgi:hypothetical protein